MKTHRHFGIFSFFFFHLESRIGHFMQIISLVQCTWNVKLYFLWEVNFHKFVYWFWPESAKKVNIYENSWAQISPWHPCSYFSLCNSLVGSDILKGSLSEQGQPWLNKYICLSESSPFIHISSNHTYSWQTFFFFFFFSEKIKLAFSCESSAKSYYFLFSPENNLKK